MTTTKFFYCFAGVARREANRVGFPLLTKIFNFVRVLTLNSTKMNLPLRYFLQVVSYNSHFRSPTSKPLHNPGNKAVVLIFEIQHSETELSLAESEHKKYLSQSDDFNLTTRLLKF